MYKSIEPGVLMNALAHMCIGFRAHLGASELQLVDYIDKEDNHYPNISKMPFIILRANSNKIRSLVDAANPYFSQFLGENRCSVDWNCLLSAGRGQCSSNTASSS